MLRQSLQQKLLQKLSPQQIQLMKMLQLPTVALEQRIKEEMEINPALEEGEENEEEELDNNEEDEEGLADEETDGAEEKETTPEEDKFDIDDYMDEDEAYSYKEQTNNSGPDDERKEAPLAQGPGFTEQLVSQLGLQPLDDRNYQIGTYLIGNIDEDGYMRRELVAVVDDIAFSLNIATNEEELLEVLQVIQTFDPPGVGARDLQECLLLQLQRKNPKSAEIILAMRVIKEHMEEFSKKHYDKIARRLGVEEESLKQIIKEIITLNPRPGGAASDTQRAVQDVIPDFVIYNTDGKLELALNERNMPELRVSGDRKSVV